MDKLCRRYNRINGLIKRLTEAKDELRVQLMACDGQSSNAFSVRVSEVTTDRLEGLKQIQSKSQSLYNALHEAGCVKQVVSTRLTVKEKG